MQKAECSCQRCGAKCKVDPIRGSKAEILKRSSEPKGLCVNCAVQDYLRNTYPANMILAGMKNIECLSLPYIREQFAGILKAGFSDVGIDEINWSIVIKNWDLPFSHKIKRTSMNPLNENDLAKEPQRKQEEIIFLKKQAAEGFPSLEQRMKAADKRVGDYLRKNVIPLLKKQSDEDS